MKVNKLCRATERLIQLAGNKPLPNPMGFVISSHMSYASSKGELNYCIRRVRVKKPQRASMEAFIVHRNITKTHCPSDSSEEC